MDHHIPYDREPSGPIPTKHALTPLMVVVLIALALLIVTAVLRAA